MTVTRGRNEEVVSHKNGCGGSCGLELTINCGTTSHGPTTWNNKSPSVEMCALFGRVAGSSRAVWSEMLTASAGLKVAREIARVLATFEDEDLQRGVCGG